LDVLDLHEAQAADPAFLHELARVADHRVRRVAVSDGEHAPMLRSFRHEVARLRCIVGDGLVAKDVEPGVQRRRGNRVMRVVGRHDRDGFDAVAARALAAIISSTVP
jgi:hypothetical protein